ncbi:MAG: hypothetical protein B7X59_12710, partial [Polaromonas sp. 39-63-203]
ELRSERDHLLQVKLLVQQQQLLGSRLASLAMLGAGFVQGDSSAAMHRYARAALAAGCSVPEVPWNQWDHAGLLQSEARRGMAVAQELARWQKEFEKECGTDRTPERAFALLAQAVGGLAQGPSVRVASAGPLTALLDAAPGQTPVPGATAWLAWLLWWNQPVEAVPAAGGSAGAWTLQVPASGAGEATVPADWLERAIEQLAET